IRLQLEPDRAAGGVAIDYLPVELRPSVGGEARDAQVVAVGAHLSGGDQSSGIEPDDLRAVAVVPAKSRDGANRNRDRPSEGPRGSIFQLIFHQQAVIRNRS